jgi:hypothetical protein
MPTKGHTKDGTLIEWASEQAAFFLAPLGNRWQHVQGVAERAYQIGELFNENDRSYLIAAAYLHDIGYAPSLKKTGFHPLDGAYYVQSYGQDRLTSLVAYHSEAQCEAQLRGLSSELAHFLCEHSAVADALTFCDLTTNSVGQRVTFGERVTDILSRYGESDIVTQALRQAMPAWTHAIEQTEQALYKHRHRL